MSRWRRSCRPGGSEPLPVDISARLQQIEELVRGAKSMPLSASVLVNQEELLELLDI